MKKRLTAVIGFVIVTALLVSCRTTGVLNITNQPIPVYESTRLTVGQVRQAILDAGKERGWIMSDVNSNQIKAVLDKRNTQAVVLINYNSQNYSINYSNSINLEYNGTSINRHYNDWVTYLSRSIDFNLAKIAQKVNN